MKIKQKTKPQNSCGGKGCKIIYLPKMILKKVA